MQKLVNENQEDWDQLFVIPFAYRTSRQALTKYTPFFLIYGREARLLIDITQPKPEEDDITQELTLDKRVKKMIPFQEEIHDKARDNVVKAQEKQKQQYDAKHNGRTELKFGSIQNNMLYLNLCIFGSTYRHGTVFAPKHCLYQNEAKRMQSSKMYSISRFKNHTNLCGPANYPGSWRAL